MSSDDLLLRSRLKRAEQLIRERRFEEARLAYEQICARRKNHAESWLRLGTVNGMLRRYKDAAACCSRAVELAPGNAAAWYNLGIALRDCGEAEKAVAALRKTLALNPKQESAAASLGHILAALHRYDEAEALFRHMLDYQPGNAEFYAVYGSAMQTMGRYEAAINSYRKALELHHPNSASIRENMGAALCLQGKFEESLQQFRTVLEADPGNSHVFSGYLLTLHYVKDQTPEEILEQHRRWPGNALISSRPRESLPVRRAGPRLRVGYVSADFRRHSVAHFIEPLLAHHDAERFEITCYFGHKDADSTTERLRKLAHRWRDVAELNDEELVRTIDRDEIDILVDLSGHTAGNRMPVFARRAAPVQATFIGYPDTTGLNAMDFRLTDTIADPPGAERYCTERLVRLPGCFLCYQPPANAPEVAPSPWRQNGFVTFGSFNNLAKVSEEVIARWAQILRDVPDARLIIKNPSLTDVATRERYQALFAQAGVAPARLALFGYVKDDAGHLGTYRLVDIALDTFPYNGTTTTCEALWMGVPVVSLRGDRHSARVGASLLTAAGFPDWIADTPEGYLRLAAGLARDRARLAELRPQVRERVRQSRLCSAEDYARAVESAYEEMLAARHRQDA